MAFYETKLLWKPIGCGRWMANTCFVWQRLLFVWQGAFFLETNAMAAPATLIAANVGDQVQGQPMKFVYAQGSDPRYAR